MIYSNNRFKKTLSPREKLERDKHYSDYYSYSKHYANKRIQRINKEIKAKDKKSKAYTVKAISNKKGMFHALQNTNSYKHEA